LLVFLLPEIGEVIDAARRPQRGLGTVVVLDHVGSHQQVERRRHLGCGDLVLVDHDPVEEALVPLAPQRRCRLKGAQISASAPGDSFESVRTRARSGSGPVRFGAAVDDPMAATCL
jgi:hypothetical protein